MSDVAITHPTVEFDEDLYHPYFPVTSVAYDLTGDTNLARVALERFDPDTETYPFYTDQYEHQLT